MSKSPPNPVAAAIRDARQRLRWSQTTLGDELGKSAKSVARWESGLHLPPLEDRANLVAAVAAVDPALARSLAVAIGAAQFAPPLPPPPPAPPPAPPMIVAPVRAPRPSMPASRAIDAALSQAADAFDLPERRVRAALALFLGQLRAWDVEMDAAHARLSEPSAKSG